MGRKIEFDYDRAIAKATRLFWQKGYSETSLRELLSVMRIGEGSFYNAVKSKKHLFLECLKHYRETVGLRRLHVLMSQCTAGEGIRAFFKTVLDELHDPKTPRVCLLSGCLSEDVLKDRELRKFVVAEMETFVGYFERCFEAAKSSGELPEDFDVDVAAELIVTYLTGLFRTVRVLHDRIQIEKQISALLTGLNL